MKKSAPAETTREFQSGGLHCRIENGTLFLSGRLRVAGSGDFTGKIIRESRLLSQPLSAINLDGLDDIDSAGVMALYYFGKKLSAEGAGVSIETGNSAIRKKIELFGPDSIKEHTPPYRAGPAEKTGEFTYNFFNTYIFGFLVLAANIFYWSAADLFRTKTRREGEFVSQSIKIGVNAALIVVFMSFAIGLVLAVQSGNQLSTFGANIYIVDLTVIAIMSQMGPLITAILVAGRSGSSIAAEIATMKVNSELDALKTMGLDPVRYVVVPKLYASLFTLPFLIILADVSGIAGGATAAYYTLDITPEVFFNRMGSIMQNKDLLTGLIKSQVYGGLIVLTGSFYGFSVDRGAEGVGRVTTLAVVVSISLVILADSIMGLLFY